jgi:hypothetical protein
MQTMQLVFSRPYLMLHACVQIFYVTEKLEVRMELHTAQEKEKAGRVTQ